MSTRATFSATRRRGRFVVLLADVFLVLFPPLQWAFAPGVMSVVYYVGSSILVTASLFVLWALRDRDEARR